MLGDDPEGVPLEAVSNRRAPPLPGSAAGRLEDGPAAQQSARDARLDQWVEEVLAERRCKAPLFNDQLSLPDGESPPPPSTSRTLSSGPWEGSGSRSLSRSTSPLRPETVR